MALNLSTTPSFVLNTHSPLSTNVIALYTSGYDTVFHVDINNSTISRPINPNDGPLTIIMVEDGQIGRGCIVGAYQHQLTQIIVEVHVSVDGWKGRSVIWVAIPYHLTTYGYFSRIKSQMSSLFHFRPDSFFLPCPTYVRHPRECHRSVIFYSSKTSCTVADVVAYALHPCPLTSECSL
jgi:hypothetical protein